MVRRLPLLLMIVALVETFPHPAHADPAGAPPGRAADPDAPRYDDSVRARGQLGTPVLMFLMGTLPNPALGAGMNVGFRWPSFSLVSEGSFFTTFVQPIAGRPVRAELAMMSLEGCRHQRLLYFCTGVVAGELKARSYSEWKVIPTHPWMMGFVGRIGVEWRYKGFAFVRGFGGAIFSPVAPGIAFEERSPAWQGGVLGGVVGGSVGFIFGHPITYEE